LFEDKAGFDTDWLGVLELMTAKARPSIFSDVCKSSDDLHVLMRKHMLIMSIGTIIIDNTFK
jgi:hypothetical protein